MNLKKKTKQKQITFFSVEVQSIIISDKSDSHNPSSS